MSSTVIGLIAHAGKPGAAALVQVLCEEFAARSARLHLETKTAALVGNGASKSTAELGEICDLLLVLGGDGTILKVLHDLGDRVKPIFGLNIGSLGFLTCVSSPSHHEAVESILAGSYVLSHRTLLDVTVERRGEPVARRTGLNDAVISRGEATRLIKLQTRIDDAILTEYNADGLVVATPTGSTAYSLSAGGPVLVPDSGVFVVTPICPHVLTNRSLIVSDRADITIKPCPGQQDVFLSVDGQELLGITEEDTIRIRKARHALPLAMLPELSFFEILREKLKWSGSAV